MATRALVIGLMLLWATAAGAAERQKPLSTADWVALMNVNSKAGLQYVSGTVDTLATVGNFTCTTPVVLLQSAARIQVSFAANPDKVPTWFVIALMADLTRHHHCRFLDPGRLTYSNEKLAEWEREK